MCQWYKKVYLCGYEGIPTQKLNSCNHYVPIPACEVASATPGLVPVLQKCPGCQVKEARGFLPSSHYIEREPPKPSKWSSHAQPLQTQAHSATTNLRTRLFYGEGTDVDYDFSEYSYLSQYGKRSVTKDLNESAPSKRSRTSQEEYVNSSGAPQNRLRHRISNVERDIYSQPVFDSLLMAPANSYSTNVGPYKVGGTRCGFVPQPLNLVREEPEIQWQSDYNRGAGNSAADQAVSPGSMRSYTRRKHNSDGPLISPMSLSSRHSLSPKVSPTTRMHEGMHAAEYDQGTWQPPQFQQPRPLPRHQRVCAQGQGQSKPIYQHAQYRLPNLSSNSPYEPFFDNLKHDVPHGHYTLTQPQQSEPFQRLGFKGHDEVPQRHESTLTEVSARHARQAPPAADHTSLRSRPKAPLSSQWLDPQWLARAKEFLGGRQDKTRSSFY